MGSFLITLLVIVAIALIVYCIYCYISTLSERRKNEEKLRRQRILYNEKVKAEQAKQNARNAGKMTREIIDRIAKPK